MILSQSRQILIALIFSRQASTQKELIELTHGKISQRTIKQTISDLTEIGVIRLETDTKDKRVRNIVILEDTARTVLNKLFGFDPSNPLDIIK